MGLTAKQRRALPKTAFALGNRRYPINTKARARNALARVAQHGTKSEQSRVRTAVRKRWPSITVSTPRRGR